MLYTVHYQVLFVFNFLIFKRYYYLISTVSTPEQHSSPQAKGSSFNESCIKYFNSLHAAQ